MWTSTDEGRSWQRRRQLTSGSPLNHTYVRRPVEAHPDFYAFWADGNPLDCSPSRLYFTNREGDAVWMLPEHMQEDHQVPQRLPAP
jgi:hypothetical protein